MVVSSREISQLSVVWMWSAGEQPCVIHRNMAGMQTPVEFLNCIQVFQEEVPAVFLSERKGTGVKQIKGEGELTAQRKKSFPSLSRFGVGKSDKQVPTFPTAR